MTTWSLISRVHLLTFEADYAATNVCCWNFQSWIYYMFDAYAREFC